MIRSNRRAANNRIRGPQSALTDFLAANNISAVQISADYERRQAETRQREAQAAAAREEESIKDEENEENDDELDNSIDIIVNKKKRKRQYEKQFSNINAGKKAGKDVKGKKKGKVDESDEENAGWDMYKKRKPLPGQLANCEECEKRFTVTPYSKTGQNGGLLCTKCSKEQEAIKKKDDKAKKLSKGREKRRQVQSKLLDGIVQIGARSLQELCIKVRNSYVCYTSGC